MYKVFFNDREVIFSDNFNEAFRKNSGLFYKYRKMEELAEIIDAYRSLHTIRKLYIFHEDLDLVRNEFLSLFKFVRAAGGLVYNSKGEFLAIKRNGLWDLPKGKAEKGESSKATAIREVEEECGIKDLEIRRQLMKTYHTYAADGKYYLKETEWFEMFTQKSEGSPQTSENITEIRWIMKKDAPLIMKHTYRSIKDVLEAAGLF